MSRLMRLDYLFSRVYTLTTPTIQRPGSSLLVVREVGPWPCLAKPNPNIISTGFIVVILICLVIVGYAFCKKRQVEIEEDDEDEDWTEFDI